MQLNNEESRQWIWIFRALWSAAPKLAEVVDPQHSSVSRARCHLHLLVPDTILFQRGEPCKWVGSSPQGIVVRKTFLQASSDASFSSSAITGDTGEGPLELRRPNLASRLAAKRQTSSSRVMNNFEVFERLDAVIAVFLAFDASGLPPSSGSDGKSESDVPVCIARYNDGTSELLSGKSLKTLCKFFSWRASLCTLQAYIHPAQGVTPSVTKTIGTYNRKRERRNKNIRHRRPQRSNANHDDNRCATSGSAAASRSDIGHAKDDKSRIGGNLSLPISSSTTSAISDLQQAESLAVAAGDESSSSPSLQSLTTALNQATTDVAFFTDLSYVWSTEPSSRAKPRQGHDDATSASYEKHDTETHGGRNLADNRTTFVIGGSAGQHQHHRPPWPKSRVRVSHLEAEFVIDQAGRPWFTNAPKVWFVSCKSRNACM